MSTLSSSPSRARAPRQRVLAHARFEAKSLLRNGEQLLVSVILPVLALLALAWTHSPDLGAGSRINVATAGVLALAVASTAFTGQAIATGFERRYGVLRLLGTTPLGRGGLLAAKALAVGGIIGLQVLVISGLAWCLGWRPSLAGLAPALLTLILGTAAFAFCALLLAGTVRAEGVLAIANLVWVLLLPLGLLLPTSRLPGAAATLAQGLPSGALGDGLRASLVHGQWPWINLLVLLGWATGAGLLARRTFRWSDA